MRDAAIVVGVGVGVAVAAVLWARWLVKAVEEIMAEEDDILLPPMSHPYSVQPVVDHGSRTRIGPATPRHHE